MALQAPRAGERTIIAEMFSRCLYEQPFYYPDGDGAEREEIFSIWGYRKGSPAILFPVTVDMEVIAIRQFRHACNQFITEVPGGLPKGNQSPAEIAASELLEETGYKADKIISLERKIWMDSPSLDLQFFPLVAVGCSKVAEPVLEKTETLETVIIPVDQWYGMIASGDIIDSKIIALSLLALPYIGGRLEFKR